MKANDYFEVSIKFQEEAGNTVSNLEIAEPYSDNLFEKKLIDFSKKFEISKDVWYNFRWVEAKEC